MNLRFRSLVVIVSTLCTLGTSVTCLADCRTRYQYYIEQAEADRTENTVAGILLTVFNFLVPPSAILRVVGFGVSGLNSAEGLRLFISLSELKRIDRVLEQATFGQGEDLDTVLAFMRKENPDLTLAEVANQINELNVSRLYCEDNYTASYADILVSIGASKNLADSTVGLFNEFRDPNYKPARGRPPGQHP